jgi:shikimate dehydrogenase
MQRICAAAPPPHCYAVADFLTFDQLQSWPAVAGTFTPPARLAVIGDPIAHSKSPQMHNPALKACGIDAQYVRVQVPIGRVKEAFGLFHQHGFIGVNITIPHKFEALEAVDEVDLLARQLGAVNTLAIRDGRLFGYNTDGPGFLASVREGLGVEVKGLRVLVLGAGGGAGRAVAVQAALAGAKVILANRTHSKAIQVREEIRAMGHEAEVAPDLTAAVVAEADLLVNATSLGMKGADLPLIPAGSIQSHHLIFDMVYRADGEAPFIAAARAAGARCVDGMSMLLHQGAISFAHWFGRPPPLEVMRAGLLGHAQRT